MSYDLSDRVLRSTPEQRLIAKLRRDRQRAAGACINATAHGPATHGVRCWECAAVHARHDLLPAGYRAHLAALRLLRELKQIEAAR